jgi:hypothetical protein
MTSRLPIGRYNLAAEYSVAASTGEEADVMVDEIASIS